MKRGVFEPGGPLNIRSTGENRYQATISLPADAEGRTARECPAALCSPGYFKVKSGTGITRAHTTAFCPYCHHAAEPNDFTTQEQKRYAQELLEREALSGVDAMLRDALGLDSSGKRRMDGGLISIDLSLESPSPPPVQPPVEEEIRRDVVCPSCGLDHTVFGLATWCHDCGADIFVVHVTSELAVVRGMLGDIDRRREALGHRIAARDLENCLEDAVSIFEASMKALVRRHSAASGVGPADIEVRVSKMGNAFQNIARAREVIESILGVSPVPAPWDELAAAFEKRNPITHNLGVVDRKYLQRVQGAEREGREIRITAAEVDKTLDNVLATVSAVHGKVFGPIT